MAADDQPDELEKTTPMDDKPLKKEKKPGDWITMPMPAAKFQPAQPASKSAEPSAPSASAKPAPSAATGQPASGAAPSGGGFGSFLSNFGINDPNTQRIVLIVGGGLIVLCCGCACVAAALAMFNGGFGG